MSLWFRHLHLLVSNEWAQALYIKWLMSNYLVWTLIGHEKCETRIVCRKNDLKHFMFTEWYVEYYNISPVVCIETYTIETGCSVVRTLPCPHCITPCHSQEGWRTIDRPFFSHDSALADIICRYVLALQVSTYCLLCFVHLQNSRLRWRVILNRHLSGKSQKFVLCWCNVEPIHGCGWTNIFNVGPALIQHVLTVMYCVSWAHNRPRLKQKQEPVLA